MTRIIFSTLAATALFTSALPAFAQDSTTQSVKVSYADLNLASPAGVQTFHNRLDHAVVTVCGDASTGDLQAYAAMSKCRREAQAQAKVGFELATARRGAPVLVLARR